MAEGDLAYSAEHVDRLLQCSVCLDRFKKPKLLPCQHTFCQSPCLEGLVNRLTRMLRCPECRAEHVVPRGGPAHFPNNLTIISFLELPAIPGERSGGGAAASASRNTADSAPTQPDAARRSLARNRADDAAGMDREGPEEGAVRGGSGCTACHTEALLALCSHCDRPLCEACKRAHMDMVRTDVNRLVSQVRRLLPRITEHVNQVGHKGAQLQGRCQGLKTEITDTMDKHVRELKTRERLLHDEVDSFLVNELRGLRTHQENLEVELASMASFCDSTESSLGRAEMLTDGDLVEMKRQCVDNMQTLREYEDGTVRSPVPRHMQLSAESQLLSSTIGSFGDLVITSGRSTVVVGTGAAPQRPDRPGAQGTRNSTLQAASDLAMSIWSSQPSLPAVPAARRQAASLRNARSAQVNFAGEEDLLEEETPEPTPRLRRRSPQRQSTVRRGASTRGAEDHSGSRQIRNRMMRNRSLRFSRPPDNSDEAGSSSPERNTLERGLLRRLRTTAFQSQDREDNEDGTFPTWILPSRHPARSVIHLDVSLDTPEPAESPEPLQAGREGAASYLNAADTSPSLYISTPRNKYAQKGQAVVRFGERGNGECQFTWPRGVGVSPLDDHVFVSDSSNHRVQVFDNTGVYLRTFGRYGQGDGEFDCLAGITVSGLGHVIIADRYNHRVQIFDRHGQFQRSFGSEGTNEGELNYPWGVACDNMGFIYVCDKENHRIQVFQANGTFVRKFGGLGNGRGKFDNPHYVAVSPDNKVYVSDSSNHRVQVFSIYGDFLFSFGISGTLRGQMKFPRGIAIDSQGFVVVADSGNNRVQVFRADGRYFSMFGGWGSENGQFKGIEGVAILANGNIVVSDRENHRIQIF